MRNISLSLCLRLLLLLLLRSIDRCRIKENEDEREREKEKKRNEHDRTGLQASMKVLTHNSSPRNCNLYKPKAVVRRTFTKWIRYPAISAFGVFTLV